MRPLKAIIRVFSILVTVVLAFLLACSIYTAVARYVFGQKHPSVFGWSSAVVITGSMDPEIKVNDLVIIHRQSEYSVRDVITFYSGSSVVTHRIIEDTPDGFVTKGDANNVRDREPVPHDKVIGKVVRTVPGFGLFVDFVGSPVGMTLLVLIGFIMIELPHFTQWLSDRNYRRTHK